MKVTQVQKPHCTAKAKTLFASFAAIAMKPYTDTYGITYPLRFLVNHRWDGRIGFPGGKYDETDTDLKETAIRELYEECGVSLDVGVYACTHEFPNKKGTTNVSVYTAAFDKEELDKLSFKFDFEEVVGIQFMTIQELKENKDRLVRSVYEEVECLEEFYKTYKPEYEYSSYGSIVCDCGNHVHHNQDHCGSCGKYY